MLEIPYWINVHKILIKHKQLIFTLFIIAYTIAISLSLFGFLFYSLFPEIFNLISMFSSSFGTLALLMFLTTLMPGIFKRFGVFPLLSSSIVMFRRNIGILMFLTALVHSFYSFTIFVIMTSQFNPDILSSREILGSLSLMILLPAWLTSNDYSQKRLGKFWKMIQRVTYLSLITIFIHVALSSFKLGALTFGVLLLEFSSWLKVWFFDKK